VNNVPIELHRTSFLQVDFVVCQQHFHDSFTSITASRDQWRQNLSIVFEEFLKELLRLHIISNLSDSREDETDLFTLFLKNGSYLQSHIKTVTQWQAAHLHFYRALNKLKRFIINIIAVLLFALRRV
jgi:hypothetical protein